jgi:hypothetical protein
MVGEMTLGEMRSNRVVSGILTCSSCFITTLAVADLKLFKGKPEIFKFFLITDGGGGWGKTILQTSNSGTK